MARGGRWYAVALLAPPLMVMAVSLALSFFSPDFLPAILLMATLMHASLTASTMFIFTPVATGTSLLIYTSALAGAMWFVVAAVVLASSGQLSRRPLQRRVA